jgi:hypothetical protein
MITGVNRKRVGVGILNPSFLFSFGCFCPQKRELMQKLDLSEYGSQRLGQQQCLKYTVSIASTVLQKGRRGAGEGGGRSDVG